MKIKNLISNCYYLPGATNIGIILAEKSEYTEVYLIDSGMSRQDGLNILNELKEFFGTKPYELTAIINTHSHADHTGGNLVIKEQTDCKIYASYGEAGSMMNPVLQSYAVWGGNPLPEINNNYLHAEICPCTDYINDKSVIRLQDDSFISFIKLPGHYLEMLGVFYNTKDGRVLFAGDSFFGREHILKYSIPFLYDAGAFLETLHNLERIDASYYIPSHGKAIERIVETIEMNQIAILTTITSIMEALEEDSRLEDIVKKVCDMNEIRLKVGQFGLIASTIRSYLTYLSKEARVSYYIKDNWLFYHKEPSLYPEL